MKVETKNAILIVFPVDFGTSFAVLGVYVFSVIIILAFGASHLTSS